MVTMPKITKVCCEFEVYIDYTNGGRQRRRSPWFRPMPQMQALCFAMLGAFSGTLTNDTAA